MRIENSPIPLQLNISYFLELFNGSNVSQVLPFPVFSNVFMPLSIQLCTKQVCRRRRCCCCCLLGHADDIPWIGFETISLSFLASFLRSSMAEVHFIGQIVGGINFPSSSLFCKWKIIADENLDESVHWRMLEGQDNGQTQVDMADDGFMSVWSHPFDLHYSTSSIQGWPKMSCEVWSQDIYGRLALCGYGCSHLPCSPGSFKIDIACWRPAIPSVVEGVRSFFLGQFPQLQNENVVWRRDDRYKLQTIASGTVSVQCNVIVRGMEAHGIELSPSLA